MKLNKQNRERMAQAIIARIFSNGEGQQAERLVLELKGKRDGGGYSRPGAMKQICQALLEMKLSDKAAKKKKKLKASAAALLCAFCLPSCAVVSNGPIDECIVAVGELALFPVRAGVVLVKPHNKAP